MSNIKTIDQKRIAGSRFLTLWEKTVEKAGKTFPYFMSSRGIDPPPSHKDKKPDAVVIVAFCEVDGERKLMLTSEYRIPIECRELGFPAGLIDEPDFEDGNDYRVAAKNAAIREMKEETGFDFTPVEVSPNNLYSSPGMTNESVVYVIGSAKKSSDAPQLGELEDIEVRFVNKKEIIELLNQPEEERDFAFGKTSYPFLWAFKNTGFDWVFEKLLKT